MNALAKEVPAVTGQTVSLAYVDQAIGPNSLVHPSMGSLLERVGTAETAPRQRGSTFHSLPIVNTQYIVYDNWRLQAQAQHR